VETVEDGVRWNVSKLHLMMHFSTQVNSFSSLGQ
jgi:hypothetical protein